MSRVYITMVQKNSIQSVLRQSKIAIREINLSVGCGLLMLKLNTVGNNGVRITDSIANETLTIIVSDSHLLKMQRFSL